VTTSPASEASAWPTWEPNMAVPICFIMPLSGLAPPAPPNRLPSMSPMPGGSPAASGLSGMPSSVTAPPTASPIAEVIRSATGSTSCFQTGSVSSTHCARDHTRVPAVPAGSEVTWSSQCSASCTAPS
jgi:hypothetical protein